MTTRSGWNAIMALMLALTVIVAGCGKAEPIIAPDNENIEKTPLLSQAVTEPDEQPEIIYPYTYPLTGVGTFEEMKDRPIQVMIENHRDARPQNGLAEADIVYEILAEGEITRFAAIFQSEKPEVIGPVRSLRPYYAEIGAGLDAMIVHAGYSPAAIQMVNERGLDHFDEIYGQGAYYWRSDERVPPHNLYTSAELIRLGEKNRGLRSEWKQPDELLFAEKDAVITGDPVAYVRVNYLLNYYVEYRYDEDNGVYMRSMAGEPHKDKDTGKQIEAANILIIKTSHKVLDDVGRRDVNVFGPGEGWIVQKGKVKEITWERKDGVIRAYIDQAEVPLIPGKTWVQVISPTFEVSFTEQAGD